jgi:hypothetical protein
MVCGALLLAQEVPPSPRGATNESSGLFRQLESRVRTTPILKLEDPKFPPVLITGSRYGGQLIVGTTGIDPMMPNTLDVYFDGWNLVARASLLVQFARLETEPPTPRPYRGIPESEIKHLQLQDAEDRARIAQVVQAGGYANEWAAFVNAYREFVNAAARAMPTGDTSPSNAVKTYYAVSEIAKSHGLFEMVRQARVDPSDVASEMIRLRVAAQLALDPSGGGSGTESLFYTCEAAPSGMAPDKQPTVASGGKPASEANRLTVRIHTWHRLAPAFAHAWAEGQEGARDVQAARIVRLFHDLEETVNHWARSHRDANSPALDRQLNQFATRSGLLKAIERYGGRGVSQGAASQTPVSGAFSDSAEDFRSKAHHAAL